MNLTSRHGVHRIPASTLAGIAAILALSVLPAAPPANADYEQAFRLRNEGRILPLAAFIRRAQAIHPGKLLEAEFEEDDGRYIYEIEIGGADGRVHEMKFDAATGELLSSEQED